MTALDNSLSSRTPSGYPRLVVVNDNRSSEDRRPGRSGSRPGRSVGLGASMSAAMLGLLISNRSTLAEPADHQRPEPALDPLNASSDARPFNTLESDAAVDVQNAGAHALKVTPVAAPAAPSVERLAVDAAPGHNVPTSVSSAGAPINVALGDGAVPPAATVVFGSSLTVNQAAPNGGTGGVDPGEEPEPPQPGGPLYGTDQDDVLVGTVGDDRIYGGPGADRIEAGEGADRAEGGAGNDQLMGGGGDDSLYGDDGDDRLDGGVGNDVMVGGIGDDTLIVDSPGDVALGGALEDAVGGGRDTLIVAEGFAGAARASGLMPESLTFTHADRFGEQLPEGANPTPFTVHGTIDKIVLDGDAAYDIALGDGGQTAIGNAGANRIWGGDGNDDIAGGGGLDVLAGGRGDDVYRVGLNDGAIDTIFDLDGANTLVLEGVEDQTVETVMVGDDLHVVAGDQTVAIWSDYAGHESALAAIDFGQGVVDPQALLGPATGTEGVDLLSSYLADGVDDADGPDWLAGSDDAAVGAIEPAVSNSTAWNATMLATGEPLQLDLLDHAQMSAQTTTVFDPADELQT